MMAKRKKVASIAFVMFLLLLVGLQFIPKVQRNVGPAGPHAITEVYQVPKKVGSVLQRACVDCHSNRTEYLWYSNLQPFAKLMEGHILQGKEALNFDEFGSYSIKKQYNKLRSLENQLEDGTMPLKSYTLVHRKARLTKEEIRRLTNWSKELRNKIDHKL